MYKLQNTGPTVLRRALPLHHYHSRSVVRSERFLTDLRSMQFSHRSSASQPWDFERKSATQASPAAKEKTQIVNSMGQHSFLHNRQKSPNFTDKLYKHMHSQDLITFHLPHLSVAHQQFLSKECFIWCRQVTMLSSRFIKLPPCKSQSKQSWVGRCLKNNFNIYFTVIFVGQYVLGRKQHQKCQHDCTSGFADIHRRDTGLNYSLFKTSRYPNHPKSY